MAGPTTVHYTDGIMIRASTVPSNVQRSGRNSSSCYYQLPGSSNAISNARQRSSAHDLAIWSSDLVEVALALQQDDVQSVGNWKDNQQLAAVSDDQARQWVSDDRLLWAVAIKPWVLVQELDNED